MPHSPKDLAIRWFEEVWNQRRADTIEELSCPNCIGHMEGQAYSGIAEFKQMREQLLGALPNLKIVIEDVLADENAAVVRWRVDGKHTGQALGSPTQKAISFSGMTWLKFTDGKISEAWDRWNRDGLLRQLGVM